MNNSRLKAARDVMIHYITRDIMIHCIVDSSPRRLYLSDCACTYKESSYSSKLLSVLDSIFFRVQVVTFNGPETLPFSEILRQSLRKKSPESLRIVFIFYGPRKLCPDMHFFPEPLAKFTGKSLLTIKNELK